jgi:IS30 family transposase
MAPGRVADPPCHRSFIDPCDVTTNKKQKRQMSRGLNTGVWTAEDTETLRQMAEAGKSKMVIAVRLKRSVQGIEREARRHGIELQPRKRGMAFRDLQAQMVDASRKI